MARDLRRTRESSRFLSQLPLLPGDAPTVLVSLYRDDIFDTKAALVLASALRAHGARPVVLAPSGRHHRIRRYAEAFGVANVCARDEYALDDAEVADLRQAAAVLLAGPMDASSIRAWMHGGYRVGYHVLSTLIRRTFDGSPDLRLDDTRDLLGDILLEVLQTYATGARVLDDVEPTCVLVEEANYAVNGPLVDVAVVRDVDVVQTITTWRDDALLSKRLTTTNRRVDARSVAPETLRSLELTGGFPPSTTLDAELDADFERRYGGTWTLAAQNHPADTRAYSREQIVHALGLDPARPTTVVFAHVLWDASLFYGVDLFEHYEDWLRQTAHAAAENDGANWIFKAHPSNVFRAAHGDVSAGVSSEAEIVRDVLPSLPPHVVVLAPDTPISTLSLYEFADAGVTVRGTPGLEMACFGKPVLTAGTGSYSGLGFTIDSSSREEYLRRLATVDGLGPADDDARVRARRYAHTLFLRRPWVTRSVSLAFDYPERGWHPLDRNVAWSITSGDALTDSPDLGSWARWALDSRDADFLPPAAAAP